MTYCLLPNQLLGELDIPANIYNYSSLPWLLSSYLASFVLSLTDWLTRPLLTSYNPRNFDFIKYQPSQLYQVAMTGAEKLFSWDKETDAYSPESWLLPVTVRVDVLCMLGQIVTSVTSVPSAQCPHSRVHSEKCSRGPLQASRSMFAFLSPSYETCSESTGR